MIQLCVAFRGLPFVWHTTIQTTAFSTYFLAVVVAAVCSRHISLACCRRRWRPKPQGTFHLTTNHRRKPPPAAAPLRCWLAEGNQSPFPCDRVFNFQFSATANESWHGVWRISSAFAPQIANNIVAPSYLARVVVVRCRPTGATGLLMTTTVGLGSMGHLVFPYFPD